jgi:hypothetical protein
MLRHYKKCLNFVASAKIQLLSQARSQKLGAPQSRRGGHARLAPSPLCSAQNPPKEPIFQIFPERQAIKYFHSVAAE